MTDSPYNSPSFSKSHITPQTVKEWIGKLKKDEWSSIEALWEIFNSQLKELGQRYLNSSVRRVYNEEDLASEAFQKFIKAAKSGQCDEIDNINSLWKFMATIVKNHARNKISSEMTQKRGRGLVRGESIFSTHYSNKDSNFDYFPEQDTLWKSLPPYSEHTHLFIDSLPNQHLKQIVLLKIEGYKNNEIANKLTLSTRSIERKLSLIRDHWKETMNCKNSISEPLQPSSKSG